jgi:hypothetical protein
MKALWAIIAFLFALANAYVGYLFVTMALADKTVHKGVVQQSLPFLGGIALILFAFALAWQCVRLLTARTPPLESAPR